MYVLIFHRASTEKEWRPDDIKFDFKVLKRIHFDFIINPHSYNNKMMINRVSIHNRYFSIINTYSSLIPSHPCSGPQYGGHYYPP